MTTIELGEVSSGSAEPAPAERPLRFRDVRWIAVGLVTVLCTLLITGSAVPEPKALRTLWQMPIQTQPFTLAGDTLYLHRAGAAPALEAYDAETGRLRWSHPLDRAIEWVQTFVPGLVLLPTVVEQADGTSTVGDVVAIDAQTGAERWRQRGEPTLGDEHRLMLVEYNPAANVLSRLRMVRPADGAELWSFTPPEPVSNWTASGTDPMRPDWFATVSDAGHVAVHRMSDRSLLREGTVPWQVNDPSDNSGDHAYLHSAGGVLFVVRQKDGQQIMRAYDADTLKVIWTSLGDGRGGSFDCGRLICLGDRPGVRAVDPATGTDVWTSSGWDYARPLDDRRMLFESHRDSGQGVLDTQTGKVLTTFPPGMVAADPVTGDVVLLTLTGSVPTEMAVYRLRNDRLELRGAMGGTTDQGCELANSRLVCLMGSGNRGYDLVVRAVG
jgi:outer membrane protein assembly factor BamB